MQEEHKRKEHVYSCLHLKNITWKMRNKEWLQKDVIVKFADDNVGLVINDSELVERRSKHWLVDVRPMISSSTQRNHWSWLSTWGKARKGPKKYAEQEVEQAVDVKYLRVHLCFGCDLRCKRMKKVQTVCPMKWIWRWISVILYCDWIC